MGFHVLTHKNDHDVILTQSLGLAIKTQDQLDEQNIIILLVLRNTFYQSQSEFVCIIHIRYYQDPDSRHQNEWLARVFALRASLNLIQGERTTNLLG